MISGITNLLTDWGPNPRMLRIVTTDTFYTITQPGYLTAQAANIALLQNCSADGFQWLPDDVCLISYANGEGFFTVDPLLNFNFIALPSSPNNANYTKVTIGLAAFLANYTTPNLILPPVVGMAYIINQWALSLNYGSVALAGGGAESLQYGNTTHGGGTQASLAIAAADLYATASSTEAAYGVLAITADSLIVNTGIYLSNPTAVFTGGTGSTIDVHVWSSLIIP